MIDKAELKRRTVDASLLIEVLESDITRLQNKIENSTNYAKDLKQARKDLGDFEDAMIGGIVDLSARLDALDYTARKQLLTLLFGTTQITLRVANLKATTLARYDEYLEKGSLSDRQYWLFPLRGKPKLGVGISSANVPCNPKRILESLNAVGIFPKLVSKTFAVWTTRW